MGFLTAFRSIFSRRDRSEDNREALARLRNRSENFRQLLGANHRALSAMAELNEAARQQRPASMEFIRAQAVEAQTAAHRMVDHLCGMAPQTYDPLKKTLTAIGVRISKAMAVKDSEESPLVLKLDGIDTTHAGQAGSKAARLGELRSALGLRVPEGFVITTRACALLFANGLGEEIARLIQSSRSEDTNGLRNLSAAISRAVTSAPFPPELAEALSEASSRWVERLDARRLAVRSSAQAEDLPGASFAGQYRSLLGVAPEHLDEAYRDIVASLYSASAISYRRARGMRHDDALMAVCCMDMVEAGVGGVLYTTDPFARDGDIALICAVSGLPKGVVDGDASPEEWRMSKASGSVVERVPGSQQYTYRMAADEGLERIPMSGGPQKNAFGRGGPAMKEDSSLLGGTRLAELVRAAVIIENYFGAPQDVEWALDEEGFCFLQCRPLDFARPVTPRVAPGRDRPSPILANGRTASPGLGGGRIHVVKNDADAMSFPRGGVLVVHTPSPRLAPLLHRAAAVVAAHGSPAGHLANVARELGVPALFRASGCVKVLQNGVEVTVDADHCAVYPGILPDAQRGPLPPPVSDSPVQAVLRDLLQHISPLNLTDPHSLEFAPDNCRSLHDITRFCHEMAVREMFGSRHRDVPSSATRRLRVDGRPMQYWLVDLDGCFPTEGGRHVELEQVDCAPLKAIWRGMTAIPWAGPPMPGGGLMSVLAESTMRPGLDSAAACDMSERNYILVGRSYCAMQSRFGYHFCTVEGFAGNDVETNYALMQFMGGAASRERREGRAAIIAEILSVHGFITTVRGDMVLARREQMHADECLRALTILGYLLIHTRQLDVAMGNPDICATYRDKFLRELEQLTDEKSQPSATPEGSCESGQPGRQDEYPTKSGSVQPGRRRPLTTGSRGTEHE